MIKKINLVDGIPRLLEEAPDLVSNLEKYNGWKIDSKPSVVLKNWDTQTDDVKFYFLGWLRKASEKSGITTLMRYFGLKQKIAIVNYIDTVLQEASFEELKSLEKGEKETYRK